VEEKSDTAKRIEREKRLEKTQDELETKIEELERFNQMVVDRELKMVELKEKIEELEKKLQNLRAGRRFSEQNCSNKIIRV